MPRDIPKAIHYYSLATNQNDAVAQNNLGVLYFDGKYLPIDISKAIYYYTLASNQNYELAHINLGAIYNLSYLMFKIFKAGLLYSVN